MSNSVNRAGEVWKEIKPFAVRDLNTLIAQPKTGNPSFGEDGYFIILYDVTGLKKNEYSVSTDGLTAALAAAISGDVVWIPPCEISGDFTLLAGVSLIGFSRQQSFVYGLVTLGADTRLQALTVQNAITTTENVIAVFGPTSGTSKLNDVKCAAYNCGSGNAMGIYGNAGNIVGEMVIAIGESRTGDGWGVYQS